MRREKPGLACPVCDKGYMRFGTFDMYCSHCDYREPHVHDVKMRFDGIYALTPSPVKMGDVKIPETFMCTCMEWDTPEEHKRRRERLKEMSGLKGAEVKNDERGVPIVVQHPFIAGVVVEYECICEKCGHAYVSSSYLIKCPKCQGKVKILREVGRF